MSNKNYFFYGTLKRKSTFEGVTGLNMDDHEVLPATLDGFSLHQVRGAGFPAIVPNTGHSCRGIIVKDIPEGAQARLDRYEGVPNLYTVQSTTSTGLRTNVYVWGRSHEDLGEQVEEWNVT